PQRFLVAGQQIPADGAATAGSQFLLQRVGPRRQGARGLQGAEAAGQRLVFLLRRGGELVGGVELRQRLGGAFGLGEQVGGLEAQGELVAQLDRVVQGDQGGVALAGGGQHVGQQLQPTGVSVGPFC